MNEIPSDNQILEAFHSCHGNQSEVARQLGIHRATVRASLERQGALGKPLHSGRLDYREPNICPLPSEGVQRYLLTSAQNNTRVNERFLNNLVAYTKWLDARLMISRFTYNKSAYSSAKSVKPGSEPTADDRRDAWYDPRIEPYLCDEPGRDGSFRWQLAPGLFFCAEANDIPTSARPLSGMEAYTGLASGIFPHAKLAMQSIPTSKGEAPKFNFTTGTCTLRNYIQKKAGLKAEFHHTYAALLVEVLPSGLWWARQLNAGLNGSFYDIPSGVKGAVLVQDEEILPRQSVEAINWGDVHASEIIPWVLTANWGKDGMLDTLRPRFQFMHDLFSMRSRSHHDRAFSKLYQKFIRGIENVQDEIKDTAELMRAAHRDWCQMVVVNSNHDRHLDRWLDEADYRLDPVNAEFFLEAQLERVRAMQRGSSLPIVAWALQKANCPPATFLGLDESFVICKDRGGGIECGWHGDSGPNGARGSTLALTKVGRRVNKGHDHQATIMDGVYSAGACSEHDYMVGPDSHSVSHIVTYPNGKRTIVTLRDGKWRA